jgi:hypothetical protein
MVIAAGLVLGNWLGFSECKKYLVICGLPVTKTKDQTRCSDQQLNLILPIHPSIATDFYLSVSKTDGSCIENEHLRISSLTIVL